MKAHKWFTPWVLVAPAVIWVLVFGIWPFVNTVVLSFTNAALHTCGGGTVSPPPTRSMRSR